MCLNYTIVGVKRLDPKESTTVMIFAVPSTHVRVLNY
jgi:hypothetical protein